MATACSRGSARTAAGSSSSRGSPTRGLLRDGDAFEGGLKVVPASVRRIPPDSLSPSIKSLNYLNNILGRIEANRVGADEALLLDAQGFVAEAPADHFFIIKDNVMMTPYSSTSLPGITRETALALAPKGGVTAVERPFTLYAGWAPDEAVM